MTQTCRCPQHLSRIALVFVMAALFTKLSFAQQDLQIMVSGPWAYVTDPTNNPGRLFLVAPSSQHHLVYAVDGTDASAFGGVTPTQHGKYTADFDPMYKGTYQKGVDEPTVLCGAAVIDPNKITFILASTTNYVISLPIPDGYSTYADANFKQDGYSESRVSVAHVDASVPPANYTTWMVLHYGVNSLPAVVHLKAGSTLIKDIKTVDSAGNARGGVSLVLGDPNLYHNERTCDTLSLESVKERNGLWSVTQYARFPIELNQAGQQSHRYNYRQCSDSDPSVHPSCGGLCGESGGGADCHTCQMSINSAIPGAIVPTTVGIR